MKKTFIILLLILMVGCTKKYTKAPDVTPSPEDTSTEEVVTPESVEEEFIEEVIVSKEDDKIGESVISPEEKATSVLKDVLFDFDKYNIRPDARSTLDNVASFLNENKELNVVIEGHCDEIGTNEYNLALGEKKGKIRRELPFLSRCCTVKDEYSDLWRGKAYLHGTERSVLAEEQKGAFCGPVDK